MSISICSLASGSSGNSYLVCGEQAAILVDAGISGKRIEERLWAKGYALADINAVFVTHEHSDHVVGLRALIKAGLQIYLTTKTAAGIDAKFTAENTHLFEAGSVFQIGDIEVFSFPVSHDTADPVGYSFTDGEDFIAIVTDTGLVTKEIAMQIQRADILALESNHDVNMLRVGRYPWFLKQRILGDTGHLSNEAAAEALANALKAEPKKKTVLLAHLSKENNFPEMALATAREVLQREGIDESLLSIECLSRTEASRFYKRS